MKKQIAHSLYFAIGAESDMLGAKESHFDDLSAHRHNDEVHWIEAFNHVGATDQNRQEPLANLHFFVELNLEFWSAANGKC